MFEMEINDNNTRIIFGNILMLLIQLLKISRAFFVRRRFPFRIPC